MLKKHITAFCLLHTQLPALPVPVKEQFTVSLGKGRRGIWTGDHRHGSGQGCLLNGDLRTDHLLHAITLSLLPTQSSEAMQPRQHPQVGMESPRAHLCTRHQGSSDREKLLTWTVGQEIQISKQKRQCRGRRGYVIRGGNFQSCRSSSVVRHSIHEVRTGCFL